MRKMAVALALLALVGTCGPLGITPGVVVAKIMPGTPSDTLCKADMDEEACRRFTKMLADFGHDLRVVEGVALGRVSQLEENTFVVFMKAVDDRGNLYDVVVKFIKDDLAGIKVTATSERRLGA